MPEDDARKVGASVKKSVKRASIEGAIPRRFAQACEVVGPDRMCIVMVERGKLVEGMRDESIRRGEPITRHRQQQLHRVAGLLRRRLEALTTQNDEGLSFIFGNNLVPLDDAARPHTIGVIPQGWRGPRKHYPEYNADGSPSSLPVFGRLAQTCVSAMVEGNIPVTSEFLNATSAATPGMGILWHPKGFKKDTIRSLKPFIASSLGGMSVHLQQARVLTHTDPATDKPRELEVMPDGSLTELSGEPFIDVLDEIDNSNLYVPFGYETLGQRAA